jgi:uncharacterized protein (DUF779 family)
MARRVDISKAADVLLDSLIIKHGPLMFHQSGGCCDGSSPMCYPVKEFRVGERDVFLGRIGNSQTPVYISGAQFEYWKHTHLTIDVVPGRGGGFSVEAPEGVRFLTVSRLFSDQEVAELDAVGALLTGAQE